jgi:hypothetical protein
MRPFRSERFVVCVSVNGTRHKMLQIGFTRRDGTIYVSFPYYAHTTGIVSNASLDPGASTIPLERGGRITSHLVKYSHHSDGRAHFSQDGRVLTRVRRQAAPLCLVDGHLFTTQLQGLDAFDLLDPRQYDLPPMTRRTVLNFAFERERPAAVKFVGYLYDEVAAAARFGGVLGPSFVTVGRDGSPRFAFALSAPESRPGCNRLLILSCEAIPHLTKEEETTLTFIGGFDPQSTIGAEQRIEFLSLIYPADRADELREQLGTIDLVR